jgi:CRP/FNR family transcriptional regulator/CRP/FNR family cyclic AMP-dependent transcriptional regulator
MKTAEILSNIQLFRELNPDELEVLSGLLVERKVARGEELIISDHPGSDLMFLVSGRAKVSISGSDGRELVLKYIEEGDFFGELAILTGEERSANVEALVDSTILCLGRDDFASHLQKHSGLALALLGELSRRLRDATLKIGELAFFDVIGRVLNQLKAMSEEVVDGERKYHLIKSRPTHHELAGLVGAPREEVTEALRELTRQNYIELNGSELIIHFVPVKSK